MTAVTSNLGKLLSGKKDARPDSQGKNSFAEGFVFVTACLMFYITLYDNCGFALNAGLTGIRKCCLQNYTGPSLLLCIRVNFDLGIRVLFASIFVLIFQGAFSIISRRSSTSTNRSCNCRNRYTHRICYENNTPGLNMRGNHQTGKLPIYCWLYYMHFCLLCMAWVVK